MHRTQISLDEPLYEALRRRAFDRRVSMSQMVREALAGYLGIPVEDQPLGPGAETALGAVREETGGHRRG